MLVQTPRSEALHIQKSIESTPLLVKKNPLLDPLIALRFSWCSLSPARSSPLGAAAPRCLRARRGPPAAAARDLQSPPTLVNYFLFNSLCRAVLSVRTFGATAYEAYY